MNKKWIKFALTTAFACGAFSTGVIADSAECPVITSGSQKTRLGDSIMHVGLTAIGTASNGSVTAHVGAIHCYSVAPTCLQGDVDHNGLVNGADINEFVRVKITQTGNEWELCAAGITVEKFVTLLLE